MELARVVIVEDEGILVRDLSHRLANLGYAVVGTAGTGTVAIALAAQLQPDVMLMDISLRGRMDGIAAAKEIHRTTQTSCVFMTAHSDRVTIERAKTAEPYGYLIKPFEDHDLHSTIELALYRSRVERKSKKNQRWLSTDLGSSDDGGITVNADDDITHSRLLGERLTGWMLKDALNKPLHEDSCVLNASIHQALDDTLAIAQNDLKYKASVRRDYGELPMVQFNIGEIQQVFLNLLVNVAHGIDKEKEITIATRRDGDHVVIAITDTWCGISEDKMNSVFDPFFTTKPMGTETGLEPWIVANIVQKHHGSVTLKSDMGNETTFTIRLPIVAPYAENRSDEFL
jgi:signal transduction histidine kinase